MTMENLVGMVQNGHLDSVLRVEHGGMMVDGIQYLNTTNS